MSKMEIRKAYLKRTIERVRPVDPAWIVEAQSRQLLVTKPPGSLGRLEEIANRVAAIQSTLRPSVARSKLVLFVGDHGVCAEGVSPYPQSVTAQMLKNFLLGGAAVNALARVAGLDLEVVNAGVIEPLVAEPGLLQRPIAAGTRNICLEPAMTAIQAKAALLLGIECAERACAAGYSLLAVGEMGIGNTTIASAMTAVLTDLAAEQVVGLGTGADEACMARKRSAVIRALALHRGRIRGPLGLLRRLGGFEIGAMCGFYLGAAANQCATLMDGFIATVAAVLACRFNPAVRDYLFAAHQSSEPGHMPLLKLLGQRPLLNLEMHLGEGTGAALAIPLVRCAVEAFTGMATFESAGVSRSEGVLS